MEDLKVKPETKKEEETKKEPRKINVNFENIFYIVFIFLIGIVIYFIFKNMDVRNIVINAKETIGNDDINMIMAATDNAINKIYNILSITTIFFTIIVSLVSIFQFMKIKEYSEIKKEMKEELEKSKIKIIELKNDFKKYDDQFTKMQNDYDKKIKEFKESINDYSYKFEEMESNNEKKLAETMIETYFLKAKESKDKHYIGANEIMKDCYDKIFNLINKYPGIIDENRLSIFYCNRASIPDINEDVDIVKKRYKESLKLQKIPEERANILLNMGILETQRGHKEDAQKYYKESLKIETNSMQRSRILYCMSYNCDLDNAIINLKEAYKLEQTYYKK
jgi:tetratricopeptide (TPR) repeat protein